MAAKLAKVAKIPKMMSTMVSLEREASGGSWDRSPVVALEFNIGCKSGLIGIEEKEEVSQPRKSLRQSDFMYPQGRAA